jgi:hypothetical protein
MQVLDFPQNSPEWIAARLGIPTASKFGVVLAKGEGKTRAKYMRELVAERISNEPTESFSNGYTDRGHEIEPEAVAWYEFTHDIECETVGFIRDGNKGCSPDRLVGLNGLLEAKSRKGDLQIELLLSDKVPTVHIPQIQGQIWISEREFCDFICYSKGLPVFEKRVYRDNAYINSTLWPGVDRFIEEMLQLEEKIRNV